MLYCTTHLDIAEAFVDHHAMSRNVSCDDHEAWQRVARTIRARREKIGLRREASGTPSPAVWSLLENGRQTTYRRATLVAASRALGWNDEGIERILEGDDPIEVVGVPAHVTIRPSERGSIEGRLAQLEGQVSALQDLVVVIAGQVGVAVHQGGGDARE